MTRRRADDALDVLERAALVSGIQISVYQAKSYPDRPGSWHAHVSGDGLTEQELSRAGERPIKEPNTGRWWTAVAASETEAEAREKACAVVGSIFGQRLAAMLGPKVIPETTVPPRQRVTL